LSEYTVNQQELEKWIENRLNEENGIKCKCLGVVVNYVTWIAKCTHCNKKWEYFEWQKHYEKQKNKDNEMKRKELTINEALHHIIDGGKVSVHCSNGNIRVIFWEWTCNGPVFVGGGRCAMFDEDKYYIHEDVPTLLEGVGWIFYDY